jgi:flagellar biosynthesis protein FliP
MSKDFLNAFNGSKLYKTMACFFVILILVIGLIISLFLDSWVNLARSGAVIVVLSLALEATGYIDKYVARVLNNVGQFLPVIVMKDVMNNGYLYGLNGNETDEQLAHIAMKENSLRVNDLTRLVERQLSKSLRKTEFMLAAIGTLVWGFADLLEQLIPIAITC